MKVAICHESTIFLDKDGNYYKISMGNEYYKRYRILGDELNACMRTEEIREKSTIPRYHITLDGFRVISCPAVNSLYGLIFNRKKAGQIIEEQVKTADYVVSCLPGWIGNLGCEYAHKYAKPLYVEIGGCAWDAYWNHGIKGKLMAPYFYFSTKHNVKYADYVLYVTKSFLQKRYPTKGKNISCSNVMLEEMDPFILEERLQKINTKKESDKVIIGTIGSVDVKYKGQEYIIKALGKLKASRIENYEYQIVGKGDVRYLKKISKKYGIENQVKYLGTMAHDEIFEWLKTIDIYAQPSKTEGLPRSLIEAMSCAVPSIGSTAGGIPELLSKEMLFDSMKISTNEIYNILVQLSSKEILKREAIDNFNKAKAFNKEELKKRRTEFIKEFKKSRGKLKFMNK